MSAARFEAVGGGQYRLTGDLGFESVPDLWAESVSALKEAPEPVIDLGGLTHVDSAGLALVIDLIRSARIQGKQLRLVSIPDKLLALARISEVDTLLTGVSAKT